jgi:symplekin
VSLAALIEATNVCLKERALFPPDVLSAAVGRLVEREPIPRLALRTLLQALIYHPKLGDFALETLEAVARRAPWGGAHGAELWEGFARCAKKLLPKSLGVLLRAPAPRLESLISESPELRAQLLKFVTDHKPTGLDPDVAALLEGAA